MTRAEKVAIAAVLFLFATLSHVFLETPGDQYYTDESFRRS
jgi:hypothetical protein